MLKKTTTFLFIFLCTFGIATYSSYGIAKDSNQLAVSVSQAVEQKDNQREKSQETQTKNISSANAQTANDQVLVITASRQLVSPLNASSSISVLTQADIEQLSQVHISELLSRSPGTWISRGNGQESLIAIRSPVFTGAGSCGEFLVLEDGISVRAKGFCNVNQLFDINSAQAKQIEIVRGTNSALYGSDAIHGVINVISPSVNESFIGGSLKAGPHDFWQLKRIFKSRNNDHHILFNVNLMHDGGFKESSGFAQQKLSLRHETSWQDYSIEQILNTANLSQDTAGYLQRGKNAYRDRSLAQVNDFPEAYRDAQSIRWQMQIKPLNDSQTDWQLTPYFRSNRMDFLMHFLPGQPIEENGHKSVGAIWQSEFTVAQSEFQWGIDVDLTEAYLQQYQIMPTNTGSAFLNAILPSGQHYDYLIDSQSTGSFLAIVHPLTSDFSFNAAIRYDYLKYDYNNRLMAGNLKDDGTPCGFGGCRYTRPADREDSFSDFSAMISLGYQWDKKNLAYVKLDRGFRVPQATELYRLQNGQSTANIKSQIVHSIEAGIKAQSSKSRLELNAFYMQKSNVIFQNTLREYVSGAETEHRGIELFYRQRLNESWHWQTNFTLASHEYANNADLRGVNNTDIKGNKIDTAPEVLGSLQLQWDPTLEWRNEFEWVKVGDYFTNPENTQSYDGHLLLNWRSHYQLTPKWSMSLFLMNLTNERYAERADFAFGNHRYFVGEPRALYFQITGRID